MGILIETTLNLCNALTILIMLILLICEQGMCFHLLVLSLISGRILRSSPGKAAA